VLDGQSHAVQSYAIRPEGGFYVSFVIRDRDRDTRTPLYTQTIAMPGEGGSACRVDADCASDDCLYGECKAPESSDTGASDAGESDAGDEMDAGVDTAKSSAGQGGCSSTAGAPIGAGWILVIVLFGATRRRSCRN
jgi:uncharacterized protein (TIGR03382 family)